MKKGGEWSSIAQCFPGKSPDDCMVKWSDLHGKTLQTSLSLNPWTIEEKICLLDARALYGSDWEKIAERVHGRTKRSCAEYFCTHLNPGWANESVLILLYETFGSDWKSIGEQMSKYSPRDIMQRMMSKKWQSEESLGVTDRGASKDSSPQKWSAQEIEILLNKRALYGAKWKTISKHLPGWSAGACRGQFYFVATGWPGSSILAILHAEFGSEWTTIAMQNNWQSPKEIMEHWISVNIDPSVSIAEETSRAQKTR